MKDKDIDCTNKKLTEYKTKMMEFEDLQKYWRDKVSQLSFYFKESFVEGYKKIEGENTEVDQKLVDQKCDEYLEPYKNVWKADVAKYLLDMNFPIDYIEYKSGLSEAEIKAIDHRAYEYGLSETKIKAAKEKIRNEREIEIARKMLMKNKDISEIMEFTDLSEEEIQKLR